MTSKYKVSLHIVRESDGKEVFLPFDENQQAKIPSKSGADFGQFTLATEGLPKMEDFETRGTFDECLKYCTIDEGNSLAYCLVICAAAAP